MAPNEFRSSIPSMDPPVVEIRATGDGSSTLFSASHGQHYHNPNGALGESRHVFLRPLSLLPHLVMHRPLRVFETGFGTGLNLLLLLAARRSLASRSPLHYLSCETSPATADILLRLNHAHTLGLDREWEALVGSLHDGRPGWNSLMCGHPGVHVSLFLGPLAHIDTLPADPAPDPGADSPSSGLAIPNTDSPISGHTIPNTDSPSSGHTIPGADSPSPSLPPGDPRARAVDVFFHDPFSPEASPECWSPEAFGQLLSWAKPNATLRTYGAATQARAAMAQAGWHVARAPGAMGKREMTLASPSPEALAPFPIVDRAGLLAKIQASESR